MDNNTENEPIVIDWTDPVWDRVRAKEKAAWDRILGREED